MKDGKCRWCLELRQDDMRLAFLFLSLLIALGSSAQTFARPMGKVTILITLSTNTVQVIKVNAKGKKFELNGEILPAMGQSLHTGRFRPSKIFERFRTINGNATLENVVFFDGHRTLRTSRLFARMKQEGRRVSGQIVLEPELGSIVFDTIHQYGLANTEIRIRN